MDINQQLQPIVASLIENLQISLEESVRNTVTQEIVNRVASAELSEIIDEIVKEQLSSRLLKYNVEATTQTQLDLLVKKITAQIETGLAAAANKQIADDINKKLAQFDLNVVISSLVEKKLGTLITSGSFPKGSIDHTSINFKDFKISGNKIKGGIIENFGSTGIEDRATDVRLTLFDHAAVFERPVFTPEVQVKGSLTVDGELILKGSIDPTQPAFLTLVAHAKDQVKQEINEELFQGFSNTIHKNLVEHGIDLDRITQGGKEIVKGNQIGYHITDSNLQRLGIVKDFQTTGESLLSQTLYVTNKRVGVNTIDPSSALAIWDEEVEIITAKRKQDTGYIGTTRHQRMILGSNNKENISLNTDGSVEIEQLSIGNIPMSSASVTPNYEGITGAIVWNESPSLGGAVGWVCLGGTRWAKFGKIE